MQERVIVLYILKGEVIRLSNSKQNIKGLKG